MDKFKQDNKFWFDFFIIFLLGNIIISFFEVYTFDKIHDIYIDVKHIKNKDFYLRLFIFAPSIIKTICFSYFIYSFIILYKDIQVIKHKKAAQYLLLIYYISCIFTISWYHYISPITYLASYTYNGFINSVFSEDVPNTPLA
jgi:hypothetical protein